jgi:hypothetical protein
MKCTEEGTRERLELEVHRDFCLNVVECMDWEDTNGDREVSYCQVCKNDTTLF